MVDKNGVSEGHVMGSKEKASKKKQKTATEKVGSIKFPVGEAFRFSLESIRKRFARALITAVSVLLGIAFMVTILTMGTILTNVGERPPESYQLWMVVIALLVCGVGIVNSMLMSVTERYKEIGTIKCLGATNTNVLQIFLIEALLLGVLGGIIGAFAGWAAAVGIFGYQFGLGAVFPADIMPTLLNYLTYIGEAIGVAALLSVAAAAYPAFYAARLHPAEALRYEV
jgi:ABC-type antimicrobial peptide transport system permease subunit